MPSCWKCGKETSEGETECEQCSAAGNPDLNMGATKEEARLIDWDKVHTLEEVKEILEAFRFGVIGGLGTEEFEKLRRFLKD